jgi:AcrR family transcriptional regulator
MPEARSSQRAAYREATRANILAAARRMFLAEGIDAVSLDAIATGAGVSRATIYQHFAGKPPLLEALLIEDWERQATLFAQLGADTATPDQAAVQVWLHRVVAGMRRASGSFALHRAALGLNEGLVEAHRAHRQRLAALLRATRRTRSRQRDRSSACRIGDNYRRDRISRDSRAIRMDCRRHRDRDLPHECAAVRLF